MSTLQVNHTNLYYESTGEGPALVFIHGLGSSTRDWELQVPVFAREYRVITFDLRGHGRSGKPEGPYSIPMFAADLAGLLELLGVASAHLVGISLGGAVAFQFALDHPDRVRTLTIVNSAPALGGTPEQARQEIERRVGIVEQFGMRAMGQSLSTGLFPKPEHTGLREAFVERWAENDAAAYVAATRSMLNWDVTDRLGSITAPTLILTADQDYSPVTAKEAYAKLLPDAHLAVIADAHHATPLEQPQEFNRVLAEFLALHG